MNEDQLNQLRRTVDEMDNKLIDILNARMDVIKQIGALKRTSNAAIYRPEREQSIIDRLHRHHRGHLNRAAIEAIFMEIFAISRNYELPELVGYLGPEGSFTHQAAESRFGAMTAYLPLDSIRGVFEAVDTGRCRYGVVPLENNQEGVVSETIDLLGSTELRITAEVPLPIHFAFATTCQHLAQISKVYSKDIGFKQCKRFLGESFSDGKVEYIPVNSTSKAAKIALQEENSAAMCSHIAARMHNVPILFDNIEDSTDNFTRFLIISKDAANQPSEHDKTSLLAKTTDKPGSLMKILEDFNSRGINMTKLESRPAKKGKTFKYYFYIDIDGHIKTPAIAEVFEKHKKDMKWLGSYIKLC
jgi:chorismate mutase/prephenate dehydratase